MVALNNREGSVAFCLPQGATGLLLSKPVPDRITSRQQLATAQDQRAKLQLTTAISEAALRYATELVVHCDTAYQQAAAPLRRDYNQAWFDRIAFRTQDGQPMIAGVHRTEWAEALHGTGTTTQQRADH
jgi:hypothetical protein